MTVSLYGLYTVGLRRIALARYFMGLTVTTVYVVPALGLAATVFVATWATAESTLVAPMDTGLSQMQSACPERLTMRERFDRFDEMRRQGASDAEIRTVMRGELFTPYHRDGAEWLEPWSLDFSIRAAGYAGAMGKTGITCEKAHAEFVYYYNCLADWTGEPAAEALLAGMANDLSRFSAAVMTVLERQARTADDQVVRDRALDLLLYATAAKQGCKPF